MVDGCESASISEPPAPSSAVREGNEPIAAFDDGGRRSRGRSCIAVLQDRELLIGRRAARALAFDLIALAIEQDDPSASVIRIATCWFSERVIDHALRAALHFHALVPQGVWHEQTDGANVGSAATVHS